MYSPEDIDLEVEDIKRNLETANDKLTEFLYYLFTKNITINEIPDMGLFDKWPQTFQLSAKTLATKKVYALNHINSLKVKR